MSEGSDWSEIAVVTTRTASTGSGYPSAKPLFDHFSRGWGVWPQLGCRAPSRSAALSPRRATGTEDVAAARPATGMLE